MPWKDKEKQREAIKKHYYAHRQEYIDKAYRKRVALREWVRSIKEQSACHDCGLMFPYYVMDFDHIDNKEIIISKVINSGSWKKTKNEIAKCEIFCSNCHRIRTYNRLNQPE